MGGGEAKGRFAHDVGRRQRRQSLLVLLTELEDERDVDAVDVLHGDEVEVLPLADVEEGADVWMVDAAEDARLVEELRQGLRVARQLGQQTLEDDEAVDDAGLASQKDLTHAADGDATHHLVFAENAGTWANHDRRGE